MCAFAVRCGDFVSPLAPTAICVKVATSANVMMDAGDGIPPAPIACGRRTSYDVRDRLLKNAHLRRFPNPSLCQSTGQACCSVRRREWFETVPYKRFRLPARSRFGGGRGALHLGIFDQPEKNEFLNKL